MISDIVLSGLSAYADFSRQGTAISLAVIAAIVVLIMDISDQRDIHRRIALITMAIVIILALPGLGWLVNTFGGYEVGRNPYEVVPIALIFGIAAVILSDRVSNRNGQSAIDSKCDNDRQRKTRVVLIPVAFMILFLLSATVPWKLTASNISFSVNPSRISPATMEIAGIITEVDGENASAVVPREMAGQIGESGLGVEVPEINWSNVDEYDVISMVHLAEENDCDIVVLHQSDTNEAQMAAQAYTLRSRSAGYEVYQKIKA